MSDTFQYFVGIDWATESHQVCVLNTHRDLVAERVVEHSGTGLAQFVAWLLQITHNAPHLVAVAIEVPRGAVVESLLEQNFRVFAINPKQLDRFRDRHTVAGAKDDSRDAFVLADSLRTDLPLFKPLRIEDPAILHLRELSRLDDDLRQDYNRVLNQFREQLGRFYPQLLSLSPGADEPWLWDLFETAPLPEAGGKLALTRLQKLLSRHRIRRLKAEQVREALCSPGFHLAPGAATAIAERALLLLPRLRLVHDQRATVAKRIEAVLEEMASADPQSHEHRDVTLLLSLPGIGRVIAATMLAEASQALAERDYHALRTYAGTAPVTRQSGKKCSVSMRQACNGRLRHALYHWARVSSQFDPRSREQYKRLRQAGHSHGRALRGVADRLLAVLIAILNTGLRFDPQRRVQQRPPVA
jgi:transposase